MFHSSTTVLALHYKTIIKREKKSLRSDIICYRQLVSLFSLFFTPYEISCWVPLFRIRGIPLISWGDYILIWPFSFDFLFNPYAFPMSIDKVWVFKPNTNLKNIILLRNHNEVFDAPKCWQQENRGFSNMYFFVCHLTRPQVSPSK